MKGIVSTLIDLPERCYLKFTHEYSEESKRWVVCMVLMQEPPEDGWRTRGEIFSQPKEWGDKTLDAHDAQYCYQDRCFVGVSCWDEESDNFWNECLSALNHIIPKIKAGVYDY